MAMPRKKECQFFIGSPSSRARTGSANQLEAALAQREEQAQHGSLFNLNREVPDVDLWELGVSMVWKMLR